MLLLITQGLVAALLRDTVTGQITDISFSVPSRTRDITKIQSLNDNAILLPQARKGCAIGWEASNSLSENILAPSNSNTQPLEITDLGGHIYGGPDLPLRRATSNDFISYDVIGHIYTRYGGIIDLGHLRDHADITRYIATKVVALFKTGGSFSLGIDTDPARDDTGDRTITIIGQGMDPTAYQAAVLGAAISYEVAVWHEITTYKTMQDYSTFSPEDNYSNLLGTYVGFIACLNEIQNYNDAVTGALNRIIMSLAPQPKNITIKIIEYLKEKWYRYTDVLEENFKPKTKNPLVSPDIYLELLRRHCSTGLNESLINNTLPSYSVFPWLITDASRTLTSEIRAAIVPNPPSYSRIAINIPTVDENNTSLRRYYTFEVKNAANKDENLLTNYLVNGHLSSLKFGRVVEDLRDKYRYEFGLDTDTPEIEH